MIRNKLLAPIAGLALVTGCANLGGTVSTNGECIDTESRYTMEDSQEIFVGLDDMNLVFSTEPYSDVEKIANVDGSAVISMGKETTLDRNGLSLESGDDSEEGLSVTIEPSEHPEQLTFKENEASLDAVIDFSGSGNDFLLTLVRECAD